MAQTAVMERDKQQTSAITVLRDRLLQRRAELEAALDGSGVSADRFIRVAVSAATFQPELVSDVSFLSLWQALLEACNDRLLPDRRQGVIVPYKGKAKWQPMYRGLLDRFEQSGQYKWITAGLHRTDDREFDIWVDEHGQHFLHRPGPGTGRVIETYAAALTLSGGFFVSVVNEPDMDRIRSVSRARGDDSPWAQWTDQMRLKTALKRLCKLLPVPHELDELVHRDDDDDGETPAAPRISKPVQRPRGAANALEHFAGDEGDPPGPAVGQSGQGDPTGQERGHNIDQPSQDQPEQQPPEQQPVDRAYLDTAYERGKQAKRDNFKRTAIPPEYREADRSREAIEWRRGFDGDPPSNPTGAADGKQ